VEAASAAEARMEASFDCLRRGREGRAGSFFLEFVEVGV
jgi:hypothetical protein